MLVKLWPPCAAWPAGVSCCARPGRRVRVAPTGFAATARPWPPRLCSPATPASVASAQPPLRPWRPGGGAWSAQLVIAAGRASAGGGGGLLDCPAILSVESCQLSCQLSRGRATVAACLCERVAAHASAPARGLQPRHHHRNGARPRLSCDPSSHHRLCY
jgi:hypothetical protein